MTSINPGTYYIRNLEGGNRYIGLNETNRVSAFQGQGNPPIWTVTKKSSGGFLLVVDKKETVLSGSTILGANSDGTRWRIETKEGNPGDVYTIENTISLGTGWVLGGDADLVRNQLLVVQPSFPPRFPAFELWVFEEVSEST